AVPARRLRPRRAGRGGRHQAGRHGRRLHQVPARLGDAVQPGIRGSSLAGRRSVLLGVNIGPNLTYTGSLATLLWRRILHHHDSAPDLGEFTRLGLLTVPAALVLAVLTLWAGLHILGG